MQATDTIEFLEARAAEVSATLRLLANEKRLLVVCRLALEGEMSVTALGEAVSLSQSALSQHLARLRADGLVATRRQSQTLSTALPTNGSANCSPPSTTSIALPPNRS
jgi:ArsR family transcriptional regulator, virulence genes transcriptional regulator